MKKIAIIFMLVVFAAGVYSFIIIRSNRKIDNYELGAEPSTQKLNQQYCQDKKGNSLSYAQALEIAQKSDCNKQPNVLTTFTENYQCNEITGIFLIDMNMTPKRIGCNPLCAVNLSNKTAEIKWKCTKELPSN